MWRNFIIRAISRQKQVIFISFMIKDKPLLTVVAPPVTLLFADPFFTPSCLLQVGTTFFSTSRPLLIKSLFLFLLPLLLVLLSSLSLEFAVSPESTAAVVVAAVLEPSTRSGCFQSRSET